MTVRRLDDNGDIVTSGVIFTSGIDEVAQTVKTRLRLHYGEYFRDITKGVPWYDVILGKGYPLATKEAVLRNVISQTPDVTTLTSFSTSYDITTRKYTVTAGVLTPYGTTYAELTSG